MNEGFYHYMDQRIQDLQERGTYKRERILGSPQAPEITLQNGQKVLNFCANNYLGFANHPDLVAHGKKHFDECGYGMASVRFICGTQHIHRALEEKIRDYLGFEDCIVYPSCFDANTGLFETILTDEDAIISDELNHASIIDGIRLCKAGRYRYKNNDMADLEGKLKEADEKGARFKLIATDGVFSMDGIIANLSAICDLADRYNALVMVDDSHATGFVGKHGRGTPEFCCVEGRIDIITGTLGKGLGGASGGYICARHNVVDILKNLSRPYLFSNALTPIVTSVSLKALDLAKEAHAERKKLIDNQKRFRVKMSEAGFDLVEGDHPIIPVMLYDEKKASLMADRLLEHGIYVIAFSFPVVPRGKARIRTQMSAAHSFEQIDKAVEAFIHVGKELDIIKS